MKFHFGETDFNRVTAWSLKQDYHFKKSYSISIAKTDNKFTPKDLFIDKKKKT